MTDDRGLDGLSAEELAQSRREWWDEAFTGALLRRVPPGTRLLLEVGCGLGAAAHALLPRLPALSYVGLDADPGRLLEARRLLTGEPFRERVELVEGRIERLPFSTGAFDAALTSMTLQHVADVDAALREIARVLAPGGALVAVEPEHTANHFYFDGVLDEVNAAMRELFDAYRRHRRPADPAVGPALALHAARAGLEPVELSPYAVGKTEKKTAATFVAGMVSFIELLARDLPPGSPETARCRSALDRFLAERAPETFGFEIHAVTVFFCVARKP